MRMNPLWIALLGLFAVTMFASGAAITCTGGAQLITIPEDSTEASTVLTCPGFTLLPSLDGKAAVFLDPDGSVSDFVLLANVGAAVQFTFVSDLETGPPLVPPAPILQTVTEPTPFVVVATSPAGAKLQFTFTSDVSEVAGVPSETIAIGPIPEPALPDTGRTGRAASDVWVLSAATELKSLAARSPQIPQACGGMGVPNNHPVPRLAAREAVLIG